jgi:hypothetical protein
VRVWTDAVSFSLDATAAEARLTYIYRPPAAAPEQRRQEGEHMLATIVRAARVMTGSDCTPLRVHFEHRKPKSISEHKRIFRSPLQFEAERTQLVFARSTLDLPVLRADPTLRRLLEQHATSVLEALPSSGTIADEVRRAISQGNASGRSASRGTRAKAEDRHSDPAATPRRRRQLVAGARASDANRDGKGLPSQSQPGDRRDRVPARLLAGERFSPRVPTVDRNDAAHLSHLGGGRSPPGA